MSSTDDTKIIKQLKVTFPFDREIAVDGQLLDIKLDMFSVIYEPKQIDTIMFSSAECSVEARCDGIIVFKSNLSDIWMFKTSALFHDKEETFSIDFAWRKRMCFKLAE